jgi:hypothetical protein
MAEVIGIGQRSWRVGITHKAEAIGLGMGSHRHRHRAEAIGIGMGSHRHRHRAEVVEGGDHS